MFLKCHTAYSLRRIKYKKISDGGGEEELNSISWETSESSHNKTQTIFIYIGKHMCFAAGSG